MSNFNCSLSSVLRFIHWRWWITSNPAPFVLAGSSINALTNKRRRSVSLRLRMQRGGGGHTFRKGDNFFRSSPTCSDSKEEVAHACGLSLKAWVQTYCSASGSVFVMQNCKHISQSPLQFKWVDLHVQRTAHVVQSYFRRNCFYWTAVVWCSLALPLFSACLIRLPKTWLSSRHILPFNTLITIDDCQEPGNVVAIIGLWHNM